MASVAPLLRCSAPRHNPISRRARCAWVLRVNGAEDLARAGALAAAGFGAPLSLRLGKGRRLNAESEGRGDEGGGEEERLSPTAPRLGGGGNTRGDCGGHGGWWFVLQAGCFLGLP